MRRKRDYQKKDFHNPFFPKKRKSKKHCLFRLFLLIFALGLIVGLYFLNADERLKIKNVEITGNERISQQEIEEIVANQFDQKRWLFFSQSNILFFSRKAVIKKLNKNYFFDELKIRKRYFDTIEVKVKEKTSFVVWVSGADKYYLDLAGRAIRKFEINNLVIQPGEGDTEIVRSEIDSAGYPLIYDQSDELIIIGQLVAPGDLIDFIIDLKEEFDLRADFDISHYNIADSNSREIVLITREGWEVRFNTKESAKNQADLLFSVLGQEVENRGNLEYIDLRFGEKVFWK